MKKIGFGITSSFCTIPKVMSQLLLLREEGYDIYPIASPAVLNIDTRFGDAEKIKKTIEKICDKEIISSIEGAEQFGPKIKLDALVIAPATGNFIAKMAHGITDTPVTMATKATLRNGSPIIIGVSTNDGLGMNGENIMRLLNTKNIYFIPFGQDDYENKPNSLIAHYDLLMPTIESALQNSQIQPILKEHVKKKTK